MSDEESQPPITGVYREPANNPTPYHEYVNGVSKTQKVHGIEPSDSQSGAAARNEVFQSGDLFLHETTARLTDNLFDVLKTNPDYQNAIKMRAEYVRARDNFPTRYFKDGGSPKGMVSFRMGEHVVNVRFDEYEDEGVIVTAAKFAKEDFEEREEATKRSQEHSDKVYHPWAFLPDPESYGTSRERIYLLVGEDEKKHFYDRFSYMSPNVYSTGSSEERGEFRKPQVNTTAAKEAIEDFTNRLKNGNLDVLEEQTEASIKA